MEMRDDVETHRDVDDHHRSFLYRSFGPFLVDWLWFSTVGYLDVFLTIFGTKVALFIAVFATSALFLWLNGALAHRLPNGRGICLRLLLPGDRMSRR